MNQTKTNLRQKLSHPPWHDWPMAQLNFKLFEITHLVGKIRRSNDFISGSETAKWGWWEPPLAFLHFSTCQPVSPRLPCHHHQVRALGLGAIGFWCHGHWSGQRKWRVSWWKVIFRGWRFGVFLSLLGLDMAKYIRIPQAGKREIPMILRVINNYCRGWRLRYVWNFHPYLLRKMKPIWQAGFLFQMGLFSHQL